MAHKTIPFSWAHLKSIEPQTEQAGANLDTSFDPGPSRTIKRDDKVIFCGGVIPHSDKLGVPWSVISKHVTCCDMLYIVRQTQDFLAGQLGGGTFHHLFFGVREGFKPGHRFAWMLGFDPVRVIKGINGEPTTMYARTQP